MRSRPATVSLRWWWVVALVLASSCCISAALGGAADGGDGEEEQERERSWLGFTETKDNTSFQCFPSGRCLPCQYSQKNDEKYHCSETGYHVPFKCTETEIKDKVKRKLSSLQQHSTILEKQLSSATDNWKWRKLLDDYSNQGLRNQSYIAYKSCVPVDGEEKLSVLGFEVMMVGLLLISGPIVYLRQRRIVSIPGTGFTRIPGNVPRF